MKFKELLNESFSERDSIDEWILHNGIEPVLKSMKNHTVDSVDPMKLAKKINTKIANVLSKLAKKEYDDQNHTPDAWSEYSIKSKWITLLFSRSGGDGIVRIDEYVDAFHNYTTTITYHCRLAFYGAMEWKLDYKNVSKSNMDRNQVYKLTGLFKRIK